MSVSNFELDITSRVAAGDESGEAPSGLVWQPTLTLWQRGETAAIVRDSSAALGDSPVPSYAAVERAQTRDPTAATGVATIIPVQTLVRRGPNGQTKCDWRDIWRGNSSLAQTFWGYALFHSVIAVSLSRPPWEEFANFAVVGVFAALVALHLGGALVFLRAVWRATFRYSVQGGPALWCGLARAASLMMLIAGLQLAITVCAPRLIELSNIARGIIPTGHYQLRLVRGGTELAIDGAIGVGLSK